MAKKILNKRSSVSGRVPTSGQLDYGEVAINFAKDEEKIFIKNSADGIVSFDAHPTVEKLSGVTITTDELNFLDGTTGNVQTQISDAIGLISSVADDKVSTATTINGQTLNKNIEIGVSGSGVTTVTKSGNTFIINTPIVKGTQGVDGTQGDKGKQGTTGDKGAQGSVGTGGDKGVQGVRGVQGVMGVQGVRGVQGVIGTQGVKGTQGVIGTQGVKGPQGVPGTYETSILSNYVAKSGDTMSGLLTANSGIVASTVSVMGTDDFASVIEFPDSLTMSDVWTNLNSSKIPVSYLASSSMTIAGSTVGLGGTLAASTIGSAINNLSTYNLVNFSSGVTYVSSTWGPSNSGNAYSRYAYIGSSAATYPLMVQWGTFSMNATSYTYTYPKAFSHLGYSVVLQKTGNDKTISGSVRDLHIVTKTVSGFTMIARDRSDIARSAGTINFIAFGF